MPKLLRLSSEFKQFNISQCCQNIGAYDHQPSAIRYEHDAVSKIKAAYSAMNLQLKKINCTSSSQEFLSQILSVDETELRLYKDYAADRITRNVSLWVPVKKENSKLYASPKKMYAVKIHDQNLNLKET